MGVARWAGLLSALAVTQACTIHWSGHIENASATDIVVTGGDTGSPASWRIQADEAVKIKWKFPCLEVEEAGGDAYYFDAEEPPRSAMKLTGITYTVYARYLDHQLYYRLENGDDQPLPALEACPTQ
ncbi:MAG: hypothetical protein CML06_12960 [Pseudomonadales bacterium]|nr:hypothetical protein [Pseudomonadales bacterium]